MRIYFVRHGDPNYKDNCLTPLGHLQAEALAERLAGCGKEFKAIYSSDYGRAVETAEHTAAKLNMPITQLEFMHEIRSGSPEMTPEEKRTYSPWLCTKPLVEAGNVLTSYDFDNWKYWQEGMFQQEYYRVVNGFDQWMKGIGYEREGLCYRINKKNSDKILIFAHGGSISCLLAHFMGITPFAITQYFRIDCTAINEIRFRGEEGELCAPIIASVNDHSHMEDIVYTEAKE